MMPFTMPKTSPGLRASLTLCLLLGVSFVGKAQGEPVLVSVTPPTPSFGVSPTDPIIFVFSEPMNTGLTGADFYMIDGFNLITITTFTRTWSPDQTTLTHTPTEPLPANASIFWYVDGESVQGETLSYDGLELDGFFTTGSGNGNGNGWHGPNTNAVTLLVLGHAHLYIQESPALPTIDPDFGYEFFASALLASNRTATAVTLTLPTTDTIDMMGNPFEPWLFAFWDEADDPQTLRDLYPHGNYTFTLEDEGSPDLVVTVNLPNQPQPNPPHVTNYQAAQQIDPDQPFTLTWAPFEGGTAADAIQLEIYNTHLFDFEPVFVTPGPNEPGALPGTATSVVIPAGTLEPDALYECWLSFFRLAIDTNTAELWTASVRLTDTEFTISTGDDTPVTGPITIANTSMGPNGFSFDILSNPGQMLVIESADRLDSPQWNIIDTTINVTGVYPFTDPQPPTGNARFYRVRPL